jgi:predicted transcriptional regulator
MDRNKKSINITLTPDAMKHVDTLADRAHLNRSVYIEQLIWREWEVVNIAALPRPDETAQVVPVLEVSEATLAEMNYHQRICKHPHSTPVGRGLDVVEVCDTCGKVVQP